jgi:dienelactone hydrolase
MPSSRSEATPATRTRRARTSWKRRYPGTQHGFNNATTPRYNKDAAALAWQRTIDFFKKNLKG